MGIVERKIRQKENVRTNILTAAWQLVKQEGWQSLSIRKIADAIEYSVPVVYDHFQNKEAILVELSLDGFKLLQSKLDSVIKKYDDPKQQIKFLAEAYWQFAFKNQEYYQLMFGLGMPCCGSGNMKPVVNSFRDYLNRSIEQVISQKGSDPEDLCFKTYALWSILHGLISIMIMRNSDIDENMNKQVMDDSVAAFIKNL